MAPPLAGLNTCASNTLSNPSPKRAAARTGNAMITRIEVISVFQVKIGMRHIVMPGARMVTIVVMKLTEPRIVLKPVMPRPKTHKLPPSPGENVVSDKGA
jgi:hypothetical protein